MEKNTKKEVEEEKNKRKEKTSKKHEEGNKKEKFPIKTIIIILVIVILIITTIIVIRAKITFFTNDEMILKIQPSDYSFSLKNNERVNANFTLQNMNFLQCESTCELSFIDLKRNIETYQENITLSHNEKIKLQFNITGEKYGEGQELYSFNAVCNNIKSLICFTDEEKRYYSVLTVVNYELSDQESTSKEQIIPKLNETVIILKQTKDKLSVAEELLTRITDLYLYNTINQQVKTQEEILKEIELNVNASLDYYNRQEYSLSQVVFSDTDIPKINEVNDNLTFEISNTILLIQERNNNINILESIQSIKENVKKATSHYESENNNYHYSILSDMLSSVKEIYNSYSVIAYGLSLPEDQLNKKINDNYKTLTNDMNLYNYEINEGEFLSLLMEMEISVKENKTFNGETSLINNTSYCEFIEKNKAHVIEKNNDAIITRNSYYNWTLNENVSNYVDFELLKVSDQITQKSLLKLYEYINNSSDADQSFIISQIMGMQKNNNYSYNYLNNLSDLERYSIANITLNDFDLYTENYCKDNSFNKNIDFSGANDFFFTDFSDLEVERKNMNIPNISSSENGIIQSNPQCCVYGNCNSCCDNDSCRKNPVLYVHGHAFTTDYSPETVVEGFSQVQMNLSNDEFIDAGVLDVGLNPQNLTFGDWGRMENPFVMSASYYYISYYSLGTYTITVQNNERIENYALRLNQIINLVKYRTGSDKIDIVAHSMGGLVVRDYLYLFGDSNIGKIILVNTPNQGITGRVKDLCGIFGSQLECEDMYEESVLLGEIEDANKDKRKDMYIIRSLGCTMENNTFGDGIVTNESAYLSGANNIAIYGNCTDALNSNLHTDALDPEKYPQVYDIIRDVLKENTSGYNFTN